MRARSSLESGIGRVPSLLGGTLVVPVDQKTQCRLGTAVELPGIAERRQAELRVRDEGGLRDLARSSVDRGHAAKAFGACAEGFSQRRQVLNVARGVSKLRFRQRAPEPIVRLMGLAGTHPQQFELQVAQRH